MNASTYWKRAAATTLTVLVISGSATALTAQSATSGADATHKHAAAKAPSKAMLGMAGMMAGPHQALAMAYRDNLATFARALHADVARSKTVNLELARPAVTEMKRSFDQMRQHHQAQMSMMGDQMKSPMSEKTSKPAMGGMPSMPEMMQKMETHLTALGEHLAALEGEVQKSAPIPSKVSEHTAEILKHCDGMMKMPGKAKVPK